MKKNIITLIGVLTIMVGIACLNDEYEYTNNNSGRLIGTGKVKVVSIDTISMRHYANKMLTKAEMHDMDSWKYYSSYGVALIYLGEYEKAEKVYQKLNKQQPNSYSIASNLGTLYELMEHPDKALYWIKKSMTLNPQSHNGSEWVHVKILEYQLNPQQETSILSLDFGIDSVPHNVKNINLSKTEEHIVHQLRERLKFVKAPNYAVGNIYFDLGNIIYQKGFKHFALESYEEAQRFGFSSDLLAKRIALCKK